MCEAVSAHLGLADEAQLHADDEAVVAHPVTHVLEELVKALQKKMSLRLLIVCRMRKPDDEVVDAHPIPPCPRTPKPCRRRCHCDF